MKKQAAEISAKMHGKTVTIEGWVRDVRDLKAIAFLILRDKTGDVQVTAKAGTPIYDSLRNVNRESVVRVVGKVEESTKTKRGFEIVPISFELLNAAEAPLPLDPAEGKTALLETRIDNRVIDLRKPSSAQVFLLKAEMLRACREFFVKNNFVEINTPKIVGGGAEGGANLFSIDYFGKQAYLAQSPQLYKQMMMASGFGRVWEIAPAFRAEKSNTTRHVSEFTSVDAEISFIESEEDVMDSLEKLVKHLTGAAAKFGAATPKLPKKFPRLTLHEAFKLIGEQQAGDLTSEQEKKLGEVMAQQGHDFYFITGYHSSDKPFYIMEKDEVTCRAFDLEFRGEEVASGGQREHRHSELTERMNKLGVPTENFAGYLSAFRYGMPPHGGYGFGIERFIEKLLNLTNVREAVLFPRDTTRLSP